MVAARTLAGDWLRAALPRLRVRAGEARPPRRSSAQDAVIQHARCRRKPSTARDEHAHHRAAQRVIPGQHVANPRRQTEDPLAHGDFRQHMIDLCAARSAMRRPPQLGHTARPLQEKGHPPILPRQPSQRKRANPPASHPHLRKPSNSSSMNRGCRSPAHTRAAWARKVSQVIAHDLVKHALGRRPGSIR